MKLFSNLIQDFKIRPIYWLTMVMALVGAWASSDPMAFYRGFGFLLWIFSNGYLLRHFFIEKNSPMAIQFFLYEIFNVRGVINSWFPEYGF